MPFTKTYSYTCDLTDRNGDTKKHQGEVTVGGFESEGAVHLLVRSDFSRQGLTAANIRVTGKR